MQEPLIIGITLATTGLLLLLRLIICRGSKAGKHDRVYVVTFDDNNRDWNDGDALNEWPSIIGAETKHGPSDYLPTTAVRIEDLVNASVDHLNSHQTLGLKRFTLRDRIQPQRIEDSDDRN